MSLLVMAVATGLFAQSIADRIAIDASVVDRVAEASQRDLPVSLLERMVKEDIELMRGARPDGTYEHATRDRFEAGRVTETFNVKPGDDEMRTFELKGAFVYRLLLDVPERRFLVRRNLPVWIERVDFEYIGENARMERSTVEVKAWVQPGVIRPVDLPVVARQATAKIVAAGDPKGSSNLTVSLIQARIVDNADSPWAASVAGAKAVLKALEKSDIPSLRSAARMMGEGVASRRAPASSPPVAAAPVYAPPPAPIYAQPTPAAPDSAMLVELQAELQLVEDLLTGTEAERREGMDRLHQLVRRLR